MLSLFLIHSYTASFCWTDDMPYWMTIFLLVWIFEVAFIYADDEASLAQGIQAHLREPEYVDGALKTDKGGVISAPNIRIQAQHFVYTKKVVDGQPFLRVEAEEDVMVEFGQYLFVGKRLEYDFQTMEGTIYEGRTALEPWFFGGSTIKLFADGTFVVQHAYVTTSENIFNDWQIEADKATLSPDRYLSAENVRFRFMTIPLLWLPYFKTNLDSIFDSPFNYSFRWGGRQGPRIGSSYELLSWYRWKVIMRMDYRIRRGPGGGFETYYHSEDRKQNLETINYIAMDSSLEHPQENVRFRFQGIYNNLILDDKVSIALTWDKLSDKLMATDYNDNGLELDTAGRTELLIRHQADWWITNFITHVRVNSFETVKQELPTLQNNWKSYALGKSGIITESSLKTSFLDFTYAKDLAHVSDYHSSRLQYLNRIYRTFTYDETLSFTPEIGGSAIYYGNSPQKKSRFLAFGYVGADIQSRFYKHYGHFKHVVVPSMSYDYISAPTYSPDEHYIFDIGDAWVRLNQLRFGVNQLFYGKDGCGRLRRLFSADIYAFAFFSTRTIPMVIPKVYAEFICLTTPSLRHTIGAAWNNQKQELDYFNLRAEWTASANMAVSIELRHRDKFYWRKVEYNNFILDSFRPVQELVHSTVSDKRDTLLLHSFYRFHPNWAVEFETRHGWNRRYEPPYTEYEFNLLGTLRSAWNVKLSYQRHENEKHRIAIYLSIGTKRPDRCKYESYLPQLEF